MPLGMCVLRGPSRAVPDARDHRPIPAFGGRVWVGAPVGVVACLPVFGGRLVEKRHVVAGLEYVGALIGEPLVDDNGARRFGGHSLRVTGARSLAALGIELVLIQLMAR